jgi:hypothetical protein
MIMTYGVVLFDDAVKGSGGAVARHRTSTEGWAAIEGEAPRRILSTSELRSDVRWYTNFDWVQFNQHLLSRNPNLYFNGFLRTEFKTVAAEIGAGYEQMGANETAQHMATVFGRIMRMAVKDLKLDLNAPLGPGIKTLSDMLLGKPSPKHKMPPEISLALQHAYQVWLVLSRNMPQQWKSVTLRRPRYQHARDVLSTPVPSQNRWCYVDDARLPQNSAERLDWCLGHELPVVVNAIVRGGRDEVSAFLNINSGASVPRSWICQPELLMLSQFSDIEIIGAFVCEGGFELQPEVDNFPSLGDFSLASYSLGLLCENFWVSMASPRTIVQKKAYPPRAIWYRAMDRILLFPAAVKLQKAGFQITGYGSGQILMSYPPGSTTEMIAAAAELGLDVPLNKYAELNTEKRLEADE